MSNPFIREVNWFARAVRSSLRACGTGAHVYDKAVQNLRSDARDAKCCPRGNVPSKSQHQLVARIAEARAGTLAPLELAEKMAAKHGAHLGPLVGTRHRAILPGKSKVAERLHGFDRAVGTSVFVKYNLLGHQPRALTNSLRIDPGLSYSGSIRPKGQTGASGGTWWRLVLSGDPVPHGHSASQWAEIMALPEKSRLDANPDGFVVISLSMADLRPHVGLRLYKPNALSGFYENTPFLPELTGLRWGLTAGPLPQKEWVSPSRAFDDLLKAGKQCRYTYLPWNPRHSP